MEPDFPAAHSMDTTWYAIDAVGHVAQFSTGENGHAPEAFTSHLNLYDLQLEWRQPDQDDNQWEPDINKAKRFHLFHYDYDEAYDPIEPYERAAVPKHPLHIDMLPPDFRGGWSMVQFPSLTFATTPLLQPLDFMRCIYWYEERNAFLGTDGVTVRPCFGRETHFANFLRELEAQQPDAFAKFKFVGEAHKYDKPGGRV